MTSPQPKHEADEVRALQVLVVDDEPMLRSVIEEFLSMLGVTRQMAAGNGQEALGLLRQHPFDCIISDIRMPEMELEELLGILARERPDVDVIATSGFSDCESALNILRKGAHEFLGKPLNLDALEGALAWVAMRRRLLGRVSRVLSASDGLRAGLRVVRECVAETPPAFRERMEHALGVAALLERIETGLDAGAREELLLAAALHEIGMNQQIIALCSQPRHLDEPEQQLARVSAFVGGRLLRQALPAPAPAEIVQLHLNWQNLDIEGEGSVRATQALWLGLANVIDGCRRPRTDRPAIELRRVEDSLRRREQVRAIDPLVRLMAQWPLVELIDTSR